jgi:hypothetical protein
MGDYGEHCRNCDFYDSKRSDRRFCQSHDFVMPITSDNIICADWQLHGKNMPKSLTQNLVDGVLYLWNPYWYPPKALDQFDRIQELLIDLDVSLIENPDYGFSIYLSAYKDIFPVPGEIVSIGLDQVPVEFQMRDIEITMTYTRPNSEGGLDMENQREVQRAALPINNAGKEAILQWIDRHHNLAESRSKHGRNLANPRFLNKNKPLRLFEKITGNLKTRIFSLQPGLGVPLVAD